MRTTAVRVAAALAALSTLAACSSATGSVTTTSSAARSGVRAAAAAATPSTSTAPRVATATPTATAPTATPIAKPNPCATNTAAQLVKVSVRQQHLWMCARHTLVRETPVTTGIPGENTHTPTGTYTVQARTRNTTLTLISGQTYAVKYWIPFDAPLFGFHDSSWQDFPYGSAQYKTDGSHGCVHMPAKAIAFMYHWVNVGATVRIRA